MVLLLLHLVLLQHLRILPEILHLKACFSAGEIPFSAFFCGRFVTSSVERRRGSNTGTIPSV